MVNTRSKSNSRENEEISLTVRKGNTSQPEKGKESQEQPENPQPIALEAIKRLIDETRENTKRGCKTNQNGYIFTSLQVQLYTKRAII